MRLIKVYLIVVTVFLVIAIGLGVYVWYTVQKLNTTVNNVSGLSNDTALSAPTTQKIDTSAIQKPIVVRIADLPETQQNILRGVGYIEETFTITQDMATCAEESLGTGRLGEILDGDTPSALESVKLIPCLKP